ncbi:MAG: HipA family kinase [Pseudomonadota bacterium]
MPILRTIKVTEYITPLREGGSLPAIVRADDNELYAMKFIGAGQGRQALIAELIGGEIARRLGFNMPEIVLMDFDPAIGRAEPDPEIQDLLLASEGVNLGLKFLEHASAYSNLSPPPASAEFASRLVWMDAYLTNVDRMAKNVNMLVYQDDIWLIDHGACLYFHHNWQDHIKQAETPFSLIKSHVLIGSSTTLGEADTFAKSKLNKEIITSIVTEVPGSWLLEGVPFETPQAHRDAYVEYLMHRLTHSANFVEEAKRSHAALV